MDGEQHTTNNQSPEQPNKKNASSAILILLIIFIGGGLIWYFQSDKTAIPIESEFPNKIVYTTNADVDTDPLRRDCAERGGDFKECGSVCASDAEACPAVCAFTCELEEENSVSTGENDGNGQRADTQPNGTPQETMTVKAYFGNSEFNPNAMDCTLVYPVERTVQKSVAVARAAINELLKGTSASEETQGFYSSLNEGITIQRLAIQDGVAEIEFDEQLEFQVGGSCRVAAIRSQITQTLMQFPTVNEVVISINGRTEDILQP